MSVIEHPYNFELSEESPSSRNIRTKLKSEEEQEPLH